MRTSAGASLTQRGAGPTEDDLRLTHEYAPVRPDSLDSQYLGGHQYGAGDFSKILRTREEDGDSMDAAPTRRNRRETTEHRATHYIDGTVASPVTTEFHEEMSVTIISKGREKKKTKKSKDRNSNDMSVLETNIDGDLFRNGDGFSENYGSTDMVDVIPVSAVYERSKVKLGVFLGILI